MGSPTLATTVGPGDADVRERASAAHEIFVRLGAKPFVAMVDEALGHRPLGGGGTGATERQPIGRDVSMEAR